jgi:hypothetical protein
MIILFAFIVVSCAIYAQIVYRFDSAGKNDGENEIYFGSFQDSVWTLFLAITSTSFPSQMLPSYQDNRDSILFFFSVITVGSFVFLNLVCFKRYILLY